MTELQFPLWTASTAVTLNAVSCYRIHAMSQVLPNEAMLVYTIRQSVLSYFTYKYHPTEKSYRTGEGDSIYSITYIHYRH